MRNGECGFWNEKAKKKKCKFLIAQSALRIPNSVRAVTRLLRANGEKPERYLLDPR